MIPPLLAGLVDDAAIFPPGDAPMAGAVPAHAESLGAWYGELVGPFVCSAARLPELLGCLDGRTMRVSVVATSDTAPGVPATVDGTGLQLTAIDLAPGACDATTLRRFAACLPAGVTGYVEAPPDADVDTVLDAIAAAGLRAKLRTGGLVAAAFPGPARVAAFLAGCEHRDVPVKCTAGLHNALRHTDQATGLTHHGFLNVLAAVAALQDGATATDAAAVLAQRDAGPLVARLRTADAAAVRARFVSFGSCSITEPVADLVGIGLITESEPVR